MGVYTIKKVPYIEKSKLVHFLDTHWQKGHALVKSPALLDFQHYSLQDDSYNFLVAEDNETKEFDALIGFIPTAQYDTSLVNNGDYWGAIWKIREDIDNDEINTIGFMLWKKMFKLPNFHSYAAIGISDIAKRIYIASRLKVGTLNQYYVLNNKCNTFRIAGNVTEECLKHSNVDDTCELHWIKGEDLHRLSLNPFYRPYKTLAYFQKRYVEHPIYKYRFLGVYKNEKICTLLVIRKIDVNESSVLRIVDVFGKLEGSIYNGLQNLLQIENAEYLDIYNYGIAEEVFQTLGFSKLNTEGSLIIPNYFEPFVQSNVKIGIGYKADFDYVAFKGDSDQDRPNII